MRVSSIAALVLSFLASAASAQDATYNIVYLQGVGMNTWPRTSNWLVNAPAPWRHVITGYDGSDYLTRSPDGTGHYALSDATNAAETAIETYCRSPNRCVLVCYSAGCARMLFSIEHLTRSGRPPHGLLWL